MGCLSKISFIAWLFFVFLLVGIGTTRGLQFLAGNWYRLGDTPHNWFMVVAMEQDETSDSESSYALYEWNMLGELKRRGAELNFRLPSPGDDFSDERQGWHARFKVMNENDLEQIIEVKMVDNDNETISRYRVTEDGILPLFSRRTSRGIAIRGFLIGFVVAGLSSIPLRHLLTLPDTESGEKETPS